MAFWNKRKQKRIEEENEWLEREARRKLDELREQKMAAKKREMEKQQKSGTDSGQTEERPADLYEREDVRPLYKNDQKRFVTESCEAIRELDRTIAGIREEYEGVTEELLDIQKIDRLEGDERRTLLDYAGNISRLTLERSRYKNRNLTIPEARIRRFEPYDEILVDEIKKMYEAENYQKLIEKDLEMLHQEKKDIRQDKKEIVEKQNALKAMAKFLLFFIVSLFILFVVIYFALDVDMTYPYLGTLLLAAVSSTVIFVESNRNRRDMTIADRKMSKTIGLLNRVKIKCVNNLNVLEYNREKFGVKDGADFEHWWTEYCKAKEYERRFRENTEQMNYYCDMLVAFLKEQGVRDSEKWIGQVVAIIDSREMVEIRHQLNTRRQLLRERIEYNEGVKAEYVAGIDKLMQEHPAIREGILNIVAQYNDIPVQGAEAPLAEMGAEETVKLQKSS